MRDFIFPIRELTISFLGMVSPPGPFEAENNYVVSIT